MWFVPMLNPDGVEYCRGQVASGETDEGSLWRKNREPNYQDVGPMEGLTYGVDLNRNYGFHWGELGAQSYVDSRAEDYIGPVDKSDDDGDRRLNEDPMDNLDNDGDGLIDEDTRGGFSALETQAIQAFVEEHEFVIALNFHTWTGSIYWPWMFTLQLPPDEATFMELAVGMNVFNGYTYRDMSERNQQTFSRHPPVDGDSNDWMYGKHNILAYTIELGWNVFIPDEEELAGIVAENLGANLFAIEAADHPRKDPIELAHEPLDDTDSTSDRRVSVQVGGGEIVQGGMTLHFRVGDGAFGVMGMEPDASSGGYSALIPGADPGEVVEYYFVAKSVDQGTAFLPAYGPYEVFSYQVTGSGQGSAFSGFGLTLLVLIVAVGIAYVFRRRLPGPVRRRLRHLARVAGGLKP